MSGCEVVQLFHSCVLRLLERPAIARAFWFTTLVDEAILREWLVNIGRRPAEERVGHLLCKLQLRLASVGLGSGASCEMPITQSELADSMGLSSVHVHLTHAADEEASAK